MVRVLLLIATLVAAIVPATLRLAATQDATPPADMCAAYRSEGDGVLTFTGKGDVVTEPFRLSAGTAILTVDVGGATRFTLDFYRWPGEGRIVGPGVDGPAVVQDVIEVHAAADYILDVDGDGTWTVTIDQG